MMSSNSNRQLDGIPVHSMIRRAVFGLMTTQDSTTLAQYVGTYDSSPGVFTIELRNDRLYASSANIPTMELVPLAGSRFRGVVLDLLDVDFVFDSIEAGEVRGGHVFHGFSDEPFVRHQDNEKRR